MKKLPAFLIIAGLLVFGFNAGAQEATEAVSQDVDISAAELGVSDPTILPTSPLYFLKNVSRFFQSVLTFNPVKEAELSLKFANEKLLEAKKLAQREGIPEETLRNALENYNREMERIRERLETTAEKTPAVENFLDKLVDYGIKQQKILDKIGGDAQSVGGDVERIKEEVLEKITGASLKIETAEDFGRRLEKVITQQTGSEFKDFKNLEVLKGVELKVPEQAKNAIRQAQENILSRLQQTLTGLTEEEKNEFENYVKEIPGSLPRQIQILNNLSQTAVTGSVKEFSEKIQQQTVEQLQTRIQEKIEQETGRTADEITAEKARQMLEEANEAMNKLQKIIETSAVKIEEFPAVFRLREGAGKHLDDARNALVNNKFREAWGLGNAALQNIQNALRIFEIKPETILRPVESPATTTATKPQPEIYCIQLWQPVCGTDGKTYSNSCFTRVAEVRVAYEGECEKKEESRKRVETMQNQAWDAIVKLETEIGKATPSQATTGGPETGANTQIPADRLTRARQLLALAKEYYQKSKTALLAGSLEEAYAQARQAYNAAQSGLTILRGNVTLPVPTPTAIPGPLPTTRLTETPTTGLMCGGIAGKPCPAGYVCKYMGNYPDASGICMPISIIKPTPTTGIECPSYVPPPCKDNEKLVSLGVAANGCPLPLKCVPVTATPTPTLCQIKPANFTECARCGYPIAESYPRRCSTPGGQMFSEEIPANY